MRLSEVPRTRFRLITSLLQARGQAPSVSKKQYRVGDHPSLLTEKQEVSLRRDRLELELTNDKRREFVPVLYRGILHCALMRREDIDLSHEQRVEALMQADDQGVSRLVPTAQSFDDLGIRRGLWLVVTANALTLDMLVAEQAKGCALPNLRQHPFYRLLESPGYDPVVDPRQPLIAYPECHRYVAALINQQTLLRVAVPKAEDWDSLLNPGGNPFEGMDCIKSMHVMIPANPANSRPLQELDLYDSKRTPIGIPLPRPWLILLRVEDSPSML